MNTLAEKLKNYKFRCQECYGKPVNVCDGCFTNYSTQDFINAKEASCLDGTWDETDDDGNIIEKCDIKPKFMPNPLMYPNYLSKEEKLHVFISSDGTVTVI